MQTSVMFHFLFSAHVQAYFFSFLSTLDVIAFSRTSREYQRIRGSIYGHFRSQFLAKFPLAESISNRLDVPHVLSGGSVMRVVCGHVTTVETDLDFFCASLNETSFLQTIHPESYWEGPIVVRRFEAQEQFFDVVEFVDSVEQVEQVEQVEKKVKSHFDLSICACIWNVQSKTLEVEDLEGLWNRRCTLSEFGLQKLVLQPEAIIQHLQRIAKYESLGYQINLSPLWDKLQLAIEIDPWWSEPRMDAHRRTRNLCNFLWLRRGKENDLEQRKFIRTSGATAERAYLEWCYAPNPTRPVCPFPLV